MSKPKEELVSKDSIRFVPVKSNKMDWKAGIEIDGELSATLLWIESSDGLISTAKFPSIPRDTILGRTIATHKEGAENVCKELQRLFDADEIGWKNVNL